MESIDAVISKVVFHKQSQFGSGGGVPFLIARATSGVTLKGNMRSPVTGTQYRFWGAMKPQKNGYPDAFEFSSYEALCDRSTDGIATYLVRHLAGTGFGPAKAKALLDKFGLDTLDILRTDPSQALGVAGINEDHVSAIKAHFAETGKKLDPVAHAKLIDLFADLRVPRKVVESCLRAWGSSAPEIISANPYLLLNFPRVGWRTADALATQRLGLPEDGLDRHTAAVAESLNQLADDGHTAATLAELMTVAERLLGHRLNADAIDRSVEANAIVPENDGSGLVFQLAGLADDEATVSERLAILMEGTPAPLGGLVTQEWSTETGLGADQINAATFVEKYPVCIITGAPGTGKSFLVSRLIARLLERGHTSIRCVAPTGKAAKRMAELLLQVNITSIPCTTIHRALEPGPPPQKEEGVPDDEAKFGRGREGFGFQRHAANPLDERIIIVEEPSMLDAKLAASLLQAIPAGTRLIFVGDCNQLPSVGPGSVLRDMVTADVPTATLSEIRRSDTCGTVVHACHAIINDQMPRHADKVDPPVHNWVHVEISDPAEIAARIVSLVSSLKTFDRMWETQVISPQKARLAFGCDNINSLLSKELNPKALDSTPLIDQATGETIEVSDNNPRVGDKVVRTKNGIVDELVEIAAEGERADFRWNDRRYKAVPCPVVNGDMGQVVDILDDGRASVIVEFRDPTRLVRLPIDETHIILAYCMTVHKMQGSGSPCVIMPVHHSFYFDEKTGRGLWNRELFYTAISRTEKLLITVGQWSAAETAVRRKTVNRRRTTLAHRLGNLARGNGPSSTPGWTVD